MELPLVELRFMGEDDKKFLDTADHLAALVLPYLSERDRLLDVGSGYGRLFYGLRRAGWEGRYIGIEILPRHVRWCQDHLSDEESEFLHLDVRNDRYNPDGSTDATEVSFPEAEVAVLFSVFTHMWPEDSAAYLQALRSPVVIAAFLLYTRRYRRHRDDAAYDIRHRIGGAWVKDPEHPLHAVAVSKRWLRRVAGQARYSIDRLEPGSWAGGGGPTFQDLALLTKEA